VRAESDVFMRSSSVPEDPDVNFYEANGVTVHWLGWVRSPQGLTLWLHDVDIAALMLAGVEVTVLPADAVVVRVDD
jgi:hypothetical protein